MKFRSVKKMGEGIYEFYCQGCRRRHHVWTDRNSRPYWDFNGDTDRPAISDTWRTVRMDCGDRPWNYVI